MTVTSPSPALTVVEVEAEICAIASSMAVSRARLLALVGAFDEMAGWRMTGAPSCAHWLASLCDIELATAREQVRTARALRSLPLTRERFDRGELSYAKVRQLTRVATEASEGALLAIAERTPAGLLATALARWQVREDPEGAAVRQQEDRGLSIRTEPTGNRTISVQLPPDQAALVELVVDAEVRDAPADALRTELVPDGSSLRHRRADAFVRLVERAVSRAPDAPAGASGFAGVLVRPRTELVVHRRAGGTELADGTRLASHVAQLLTCDADLRVMDHRADGSPADVGRRHRLVTPRLRRLVAERDGGRCQYPACESRHFLDVHHIVHWEDGGPTDLANLMLLCGYHHRFVHAHGWPGR